MTPPAATSDRDARVPAPPSPSPTGPAATCQVCGTPAATHPDSIFCRVCGEPVIVWGWAP
jgi:hypothetical protein